MTIREHRKELGMTRRGFAQYLAGLRGVPPSSAPTERAIIRWESGEQPITPRSAWWETLNRILKG